MTVSGSYFDDQDRIYDAIEQGAEKVAANVLRLIGESLTGRLSDRAAHQGCRIPWWVYEWDPNAVSVSAWCLVKGKGILYSDDWVAMGKSSPLNRAAQKKCNATKGALTELFSGNWNGLKDGVIRRRVRAIHGRKIEECDWKAYRSEFIAKEFPGAHYWQGCWYTADGLIAAQNKAGAEQITEGVLSPYQGMTEAEGYRFLSWAWSQHDSSADEWLKVSPDPQLDERLLSLGLMLLASGHNPARLLHRFCSCKEDPRLCWMVPANDNAWAQALRIERIWHQLPGYDGADLADI